MDFTREQSADLAAAVKKLTDFEEFVLRRFAVYTHEFKTRATTTQPRPEVRNIEPLTDMSGKTSPQGRWHLNKNWVDFLTDEVFVLSCTSVGGDRFDYGGQVILELPLPKAWVYGEMESDEEYKNFLRLKAIYEGKR